MRLALLKNNFTHSFLIEEIRNKVQHLTTQNWSIHFEWVKAHNEIEEKEVADKLAKEAAQDVNEQNIVYDRIPTIVATEIKMKGLIKWQTQWDSTEKGALCKSFFPLVEQRLKMKIPTAQELLLSPDTGRQNLTFTDLN